MAKHDRRKSSGQASSSQPVTIQVPLPVLGVVNGVREAFHGLCITTGLQVLEAMMEGDREALCGPEGGATRSSGRRGAAGARTVRWCSAGVRSRCRGCGCGGADGEVPLVSFEWAAATDPLDEHTMAAVRGRGIDAVLREHGWTRCRPT